MIAALAFLAIPATLYVANPEFTCGECDDTQEYDDEEYYDRDDTNSEEERLKPEEPPQEQAKEHHERLIQAANDFLRQEETRVESPRNSTSPQKKKDDPPAFVKRNPYTMLSEQSSGSPIVPPIPAAAAAASQTPTQTHDKDKNSVDIPSQNFTPKSTPLSGKKDDSIQQPRSNSAYRLRVEHQQQQLLIQQQHEEYLQQLQNIRNSSPMRYYKPSSSSVVPSPAPAAIPSTMATPVSSSSAGPASSTTPLSALIPASTPSSTSKSLPTGASRASAPLRARAEPQQSEGVSPRHREQQSASELPSAAAQPVSGSKVTNNLPQQPKETTPTPPILPVPIAADPVVKATNPYKSAGYSPVNSTAQTQSPSQQQQSSGIPVSTMRTPSPQSIMSHRTSPQSALPPLPPRRREDHSPAQSAPLVAAAPGSSPAPAPVSAAVVTPPPSQQAKKGTPAPSSDSTPAYLTPRERQQRALSELRKQEDTQRSAAKVMIQEELQRALDELHAQEALQREHELTERSRILEEQRRRELIQQSILEEKLRIERDEENRRAERRKLQESQRSLEENRRQSDQDAMANLLKEVERDRAAEEKKFQEEQLSRVERMLREEEDRQHEILEHLRQQNQYPNPRGHPKSDILSAIVAGNFVDTNPYPSAHSSPSASPRSSPNSSMRNVLPPRQLSSTSGDSHKNDDSPAAGGVNNGRNGSATRQQSRSRPSGIPTRAASPSVTNGRSSVGSATAPSSTGSNSRMTAGNSRSSSAARDRHMLEHSLEHKEQTTEGLSLETHFMEHTETRKEVHHHEELHHHYQDHTYASASKSHVAASPPSRFSLGAHQPSKGNSPAVSTISPDGMPPRAHGITSSASTPAAAVSTAPSTNSSPSATSAAAAALAASVNARVNMTNKSLQEAMNASERAGLAAAAGAEGDEVVLLQEEVELRVLHAREDLALKIDFYIRTQKKFSSAVPLKYKCPISKLISDCEKHRKAYNQLVGEEAFKIHALLGFMESHPRFNVSGGRQMVSVAFLTPYQASDSRRVYGHFRCSKCIKYFMEGGVNKSDYHSWESAYSYKDSYQACYQCDVQVYPFHQRFLKKSELNFDDRAKHDVSRCSKCEAYKRPCYEV